MRLRLPWGRRARARRALAAARAWQDYEREQAYERISGLAVELLEIGPDGSRTARCYRWSGGAR